MVLVLRILKATCCIIYSVELTQRSFCRWPKRQTNTIMCVRADGGIPRIMRPQIAYCVNVERAGGSPGL